MSRQWSRRERQIMEILYERGEATINDIVERIADPPSRTAVRTIVRILLPKASSKMSTAWSRSSWCSPRSMVTASGSIRSG